MRHKIKALTQDNFLRHNALFFSGSILVAAINYLYHPIISRFISVHDFGESQSFLSIYTEIGIIIGAIGTIAIHVTANASEEKRIVYLKQLQIISFWFIGILIALIALLLPFVKTYFHFETLWPFIPIFIMLFINTASIFRNSFLQGIHDFKAVTLSNIIASSTKLLFTIVLIMLGTAVFGILTGYLLAAAAAFIYVWFKTKKDFIAHPISSSQSVQSIRSIIKKELPYALLILSTIGFVTFLYTGDILVIKRFFTSEETGLYSGISTIARIVFFATASVAGVLLPHIKISNSAGENMRTLRKALGITGVLGISVLALFVLIPEVVIKVMIGSRYLPYASLLPILGFTMFIVALVNLLFYYFVGLRNYWIIVISAIGALLILWRIAYFHQSPYDIIIGFLVGSSVMLVLLGLLVFKQYSTRTA